MSEVAVSYMYCTLHVLVRTLKLNILSTPILYIVSSNGCKYEACPIVTSNTAIFTCPIVPPIATIVRGGDRMALFAWNGL